MFIPLEKGSGKILHGLNEKLAIKKSIPHDEEINKARIMPQDTKYVATLSASGNVAIVDIEQSSIEAFAGPNKHEKEGYGLCWNEKKKGALLSGALDSKVFLWDINLKASILEPVATYKNHEEGVLDVAWHRFKPEVFGSSGMDKKVILYDSKAPSAHPLATIEGFAKEVNSIDFNPMNENTMAAASSDGHVTIWDLRQLKYHQCSLEQHEDEAICVTWAPFAETVLASGSKDSKVIIWDLAKLGQEISKEDAEEGPPELIFTHAGHKSGIVDISWNPKEELMLASVEEANSVHVWKMALLLP